MATARPSSVERMEITTEFHKNRGSSERAQTSASVFHAQSAHGIRGRGDSGGFGFEAGLDCPDHWKEVQQGNCPCGDRGQRARRGPWLCCLNLKVLADARQQVGRTGIGKDDGNDAAGDGAADVFGDKGLFVDQGGQGGGGRNGAALDVCLDLAEDAQKEDRLDLDHHGDRAGQMRQDDVAKPAEGGRHPFLLFPGVQATAIAARSAGSGWQRAAIPKRRCRSSKGSGCIPEINGLRAEVGGDGGKKAVLRVHEQVFPR